VTGRILVGVDGSEGSLRALRWAAEEAALRGAVVVAAAVWQSPYDYLLGSAGYYVPVDEGELVKAARDTLAKAIATVAAEHPDVRIEPLVVEGDPAETLCEQADNADLLVVGSRGHGAFGELLLGSVSSKCAHHCRRPVLIIPKGDQASASA
jgi:nucleotide-binding universal stress UspA family protein